MTTHHIRLAFELLNEVFPDPTCQQVASYLSRKGSLPFNVLVRDLTPLSAADIARALAMLTMHDIVECQSDDRADSKFVLYAFNLKRTLDILHYPKCIHCARQLYGFDGELIVEELLLNGKQRMSTLLVQVYERLIKAGRDPQVYSLQAIKEKFQSLVAAQFLLRCTIQDTTNNRPRILEETVSGMQAAPELTADGWRYLLVNQQETDEPTAKRLKTAAPTFGDEKVFWKVNFQRFFGYLRDQDLIQAFVHRIDQNAGDVVRTILHLAEVKPNPERTFPISFIEIAKEVPKINANINEDLLQKYVNVIITDVNNCVTKIGDQGRGTYVIDFQKALAGLTKAHIQSFLRERYGSNALRIYNMLEERGCLSQKQIEDMAMINAKEAQQYVYSMFMDGILSAEELSKATDFNPTRTFYFFRVNFYYVALCLLDHSYKSMWNLMKRHLFEKDRHRKLIDKREKVDAYIHTLREQNAEEEQIKEVEDILSPVEKLQIQKLDAAFRKIGLAQLQLTETILLLEMYLSVSKTDVPPPSKGGARATAKKLASGTA